MRRASLRSMKSLVSKSRISPETLHGKPVGLTRLISRIPDCPFFNPVQNSSTEFPRQVIAPIPVITTLFSYLVLM